MRAEIKGDEKLSFDLEWPNNNYYYSYSYEQSVDLWTTGAKGCSLHCKKSRFFSIQRLKREPGCKA